MASGDSNSMVKRTEVPLQGCMGFFLGMRRLGALKGQEGGAD